MSCLVCHRPTPPHFLYCPRCRNYGYLAADDQSLLSIREAMIDAFDEALGGFRCRLSGVPLDETCRNGPFSPVFDHLYPGGKRLIMVGRLMNFMKTNFTGPQFTAIVPALSDHLETGAPFDRSLVPRLRSGLEAPLFTGLPRSIAPWEAPRRGVTDCVVCRDPLFPRSMYCARCRRFITTQRENAARRRAMTVSWSAKLRGFLCHYTGLVVEELDYRDLWYLTFDHRIPGKAGDLVVAALWVNRMKSFLTEAEFGAVLRQLADHFRLGTPFDPAVIDRRRFALNVRKLASASTLKPRAF